MPLTPQVTISGNLVNLFGAPLIGGSLLVTLAGTGSLIPQIAGTGMVATTTPLAVVTDGSGHFSFTVWGNDVIQPASYYTVQVQDALGNIVQTNAYRFSGIINADLSTLTPFNPYGWTVFTPGMAGPPIIVEPVIGTFPGTIYNTSRTPMGALIALFYGAGFLRPILDYSMVGTTITLTFSTNAGDNLYAIYVAN